VLLSFPRRQDGFYTVPLAVAAVDQQGSVTFHHSLRLQRNQMRKHVRAEIKVDVVVRPLASAGGGGLRPGTPLAVKASTVDVSGGGLAFLANEKFEAGDVLDLSFSLPRANLRGVHGKVLRVSVVRTSTGDQHRHHVEFVQIDEGQRSSIVAFVLSQQRQIYRWR
jgi:c-di-GMP-binding flagellar brake protein YcgR